VRRTLILRSYSRVILLRIRTPTFISISNQLPIKIYIVVVFLDMDIWPSVANFNIAPTFFMWISLKCVETTTPRVIWCKIWWNFTMEVYTTLFIGSDKNQIYNYVKVFLPLPMLSTDTLTKICIFCRFWYNPIYIIFFKTTRSEQLEAFSDNLNPCINSQCHRIIVVQRSWIDCCLH